MMCLSQVEGMLGHVDGVNSFYDVIKEASHQQEGGEREEGVL